MPMLVETLLCLSLPIKDSQLLVGVWTVIVLYLTTNTSLYLVSFHSFFGCINFFGEPIPTPSADMTGSSWAYVPEVIAMAFLLETTIACFSCNPAIPELANADHWAFYSFKPGVKTTCHSPPYLLLKNVNQCHFEPVIICAQLYVLPPSFC